MEKAFIPPAVKTANLSRFAGRIGLFPLNFAFKNYVMMDMAPCYSSPPILTHVRDDETPLSYKSR
jgi:hypothetical protein